MNAELILFVEAVSIGIFAVVATNLDNLLLSINVAQVDGVKRAATVFLLVQVLTIMLALGLSQGLEGFPNHLLGYLGILPISLGIFELFRRIEQSAIPSSIGITQAALVLASNSGDSLAILIVTFTDLSERFDWATTAGALVTALALTIALVLINSFSATQKYLGRIARTIQPWLMIAVGIFVLWDSPIDVQ